MQNTHPNQPIPPTSRFRSWSNNSPRNKRSNRNCQAQCPGAPLTSKSIRRELRALDNQSKACHRVIRTSQVIQKTSVPKDFYLALGWPHRAVNPKMAKVSSWTTALSLKTRRNQKWTLVSHLSVRQRKVADWILHKKRCISSPEWHPLGPGIHPKKTLRRC